MNSLVELREIHFFSEPDLLARLKKAIHAILSRFKDALSVYEGSMGEEILAEDVTPALLAAVLPRVHASANGARAERDTSHNTLLTRWAAYPVATEVPPHEVGPRVSPERPRSFERTAASALLLVGQEEIIV